MKNSMKVHKVNTLWNQHPDQESELSQHKEPHSCPFFSVVLGHPLSQLLKSCIHFACVWSANKWNQTTYMVFCLASYAWCCVLDLSTLLHIVVVCSFLWLCSSPGYLFIHVFHSWWASGCSQFLVITHSAVNIFVPVFQTRTLVWHHWVIG